MAGDEAINAEDSAMATLVAGFGTSHSPMLAAQADDWADGAFLPRDKARLHADLDGNDCRYDDLLRNAPADASERIAPSLLRQRHAVMLASVERLQREVADARLDCLIVIGDDQEELFDFGNMPAVAVHYGPHIVNAKAASVNDPLSRARMRYQEAEQDVAYPCHPALALHLIAALQADGFDLSVTRDLANQREGHAFSYVHRFCMGAEPIPIVPVFLNAYYPPNQPSPARCHALGEAIARAVAAWPQEARVGILASGGLSHFVVDEPFDNDFLAALQRHDTAFLANVPMTKLRSGSSEIRNWICLAGAVQGMDMVWSSYVPGYRTPALTGTGLAFASFR